MPSAGNRPRQAIDLFPIQKPSLTACKCLVLEYCSFSLLETQDILTETDCTISLEHAMLKMEKSKRRNAHTHHFLGCRSQRLNFHRATNVVRQAFANFRHRQGSIQQTASTKPKPPRKNEILRTTEIRPT
jgi:hypothetical protein